MSKQYALEVPVIPELDPSLIVDVDLFGPEIKAHPEPLFAEWASKPPFYAMVNGRPNVVICRHADVDKAFVDFDTFSVEPRPGWGGDPFDYFNSLPTVGDIDPPDHTRLRKLMQPAFTPKRVNELQAGVDALTDQMLEEMAEKGRTLKSAPDRERQPPSPSAPSPCVTIWGARWEASACFRISQGAKRSRCSTSRCVPSTR